MFHVKPSIAGIDYIRLTAAHGPAAHHLKVVGETLLDLEAMSEHKQKQKSRLGYRGWVAGSVFIGENEEGWMLDVSGVLAGHPTIRAGCEGWRCTRIDIQVSMAQELPADQQIGEHAKESLVARADKGKGRPWKITHIIGHGNGDTLNLGSRKSSIYGRIYNKGAQSGEARYEGMVRYEVEFKKQMARDVFERYAGSVATGELSSSIVVAAYQRWGVTIPQLQDVVGVALTSTKRTSDSARKLRWLAEQVRPAVSALIEEGYGEAVLTSLGFGSTMTPTALYSVLDATPVKS